MVAWDLSFDPITSTIEHSWIWLQGGNYFGVPFSNYLGWFLTVFVFCQLFALYLRGQPEASTATRPLSRDYWRLAVLVYGAIALGTPFNILTQTPNTTLVYAAGVLSPTPATYVAS